MMPDVIKFIVGLTLFLPLIRSAGFGMGVEIHIGDTQTYREDFDALAPQFVRVTFSWALQEPEPGEYQKKPARRLS